MITDIFNYFVYFLKLTFSQDVQWIVLPLFLTTLAVVLYVEKYKDEKIGWNTYLGNSLVLFFVSVSLLKYIYNLNGNGAYSFIDFYWKTFAVVLLLIIGIILFFINFGHIIPEKIAMHLSSFFTVNAVSYMIILFVYSQLEDKFLVFISLALLSIIFILILSLIKFPAKILFLKIKRMKENEKIQDISEEKKKMNRLKNEVEKEQKIQRQRINEIKRQKELGERLKKKLRK